MEILEDILDNIDVCTFVVDNDGKYLYENKPFTNILNKKREDIIGTYNSEYWEEHTYKTLEENNIEVFEGKSAKIFHEEVAICDNINWYESYKAPIFDEFIGIIGLSYSNGNSPKFNSDEYMKYICNKIAMLIKNIRLLNEVSIENKKRKYTEKELEQYLDVSVNLVAIVDKNGYFKRVNFSWYNVLRWTEEELLSMSCKDIIHPEESIKFKDKKKLWDKEGIITRDIIKFRYKNGNYIYLEQSSKCIGEQEDYISTARDITRELEIEKENRILEEAVQSEIVKKRILFKYIS